MHRKLHSPLVRHDLLVIGDANPDLILTGDVEPAFGQVEKLVDHGYLTLGGSASIVAAGAARLGLRTAIAAVVGDDALGRVQAAALAEAGVGTSGLIVDPDRPTGVTVVLSRGDDRAILTALGTIGALTAGQVDSALVTGARHVHVSSYFLQPALGADLPVLLRAARDAGAGVSLDTNWDPSGRWDVGALLSLVDVFLPNLAEAQAITGERDAAAAAVALARTVPVVVVKLGADGALARAGDEVARAVPPTVEVADTTGAGDSFAAGFLAGRLRGWPLPRALELACACGALSTRAAGGTDAQPDLDEALAARR
jgi:sugar/nucleoside kinase (ribokinase family)